MRGYADQQWIFIDADNGAQDPLNSDNIITSGLNQILLIYPGSLSHDEDSKLKFEQLAVTGSDNSGTVDAQALQRQAPNGQVFSRMRTSNSYILAAHIEGQYVEDDLPLDESLSLAEAAEADEPLDEPASAGGDEEETKDENSTEINAVVVADIDWIIPDFFYIRQGGGGEILPATQNVTFILDIIDALAGDDRFINIRKRTRKHRTLSKIDDATKKYRDIALDQQEESIQEIEEELQAARERFQKKLDAVDKIEGISAMAREQRKEAVRLREQDRLEADIKAIETRRSRKLKQIEYDLEQEVRAVQGRYKKFAILIPPIPPLLVALYVFFRRREAEREGIVKERLR